MAKPEFSGVEIREVAVSGDLTAISKAVTAR